MSTPVPVDRVHLYDRLKHVHDARPVVGMTDTELTAVVSALEAILLRGERPFDRSLSLRRRLSLVQ